MEVNKILEDYYDSKLTKSEAIEKLKALGIDVLVEFILTEV